MNTEQNNLAAMEKFQRDFFVWPDIILSEEDKKTNTDFWSEGKAQYDRDIYPILDDLIKGQDAAFDKLISGPLAKVHPCMYPFVMLQAAEHKNSLVFNFAHMVVQLNADRNHSCLNAFCRVLSAWVEKAPYYLQTIATPAHSCKLIIALCGLKLEIKE